MGLEPSIRWRGQEEDRAPMSESHERHNRPGQAYRRRTPSEESSPLDGARLRRRESYPSSQAFDSVDSMQSSETSTMSSRSGSIEQDEGFEDAFGFRQSHSSSVEALPATSHNFAQLFPSSRKLMIRHDDTTLDGNMNLRVDSPITTARGIQRNMTLFHLRMYDLKCRDFSLRRYCRESGREVCHCVRKSHKSVLGARPNIRRSLSSAFAAMLPRHDSKQDQKHARQPPLQRQDSGYDTVHSEREEELERPHSAHSNGSPAKDASDLINLEFSNYAHLNLRRRGFKADKRYDFDYWGVSYSWHRSVQRLGTSREVSYHLTDRNGSLIARIVPEALSEDEVNTETDKGGWIPPCSIRILDKRINNENLADVADVVIATGLIALVDDTIRHHFHPHATKNRFRFPAIKGRLHRKTEVESQDHTEATTSPPVPHHRKLLTTSL